MKKIIIAIDGLSSTGKSTLARQLAQRLNYTYIDSGAMYRAITFYFLENNINLDNEKEVEAALQNIKLSFSDNKICLNGQLVESKIREMRISGMVSEVSAIEAVRKFAVAQQQNLGIEKGIVMDGRDIGTSVFPHAELKIFLHADQNTRTMRRYDELKIKDENISWQAVEENLTHRDHIDTTRTISPLRKAEDAVELDNSTLNMPQQLDIAHKWALEKINN